MRTRFLAATAAYLGLFALLNVSFAADQPAARPATGRTTDRATTTNRDTADHGKVDKKTEGDAIRISQLRGLTVRNSAGEWEVLLSKISFSSSLTASAPSRIPSLQYFSRRPLML